jgi:hypothetical protein
LLKHGLLIVEDLTILDKYVGYYTLVKEKVYNFFTPDQKKEDPMSRRIGIIRLEEAKAKKKQGDWYKQIYLWDVRSLATIRAYAVALAPWMRLDITEVIWCNAAEVHFDPAVPVLDRRVFLFSEQAQRDKQTIKGSTTAGWTKEDVLRVYFRQASPYLAGTKRQASLVAPIASLFDAAGRLRVEIGEQMAFLVRQATGIVNLTYTTASLIAYPQMIDER